MKTFPMTFVIFAAIASIIVAESPAAPSAADAITTTAFTMSPGETNVANALQAFIVEGYGHAERFYIPWRSMGHKEAPTRIGFTISLQDDDNDGERDHTLYWTGNPAKPHLDERAYGVVVIE